MQGRSRAECLMWKTLVVRLPPGFDFLSDLAEDNLPVKLHTTNICKYNALGALLTNIFSFTFTSDLAVGSKKMAKNGNKMPCQDI